MKKKCFLFIFLCSCLFCFFSLDISKQIDTERLIRIHVLANSDSKEDQALKLQVKNEIIRYLQPQLSQASSIVDSRQKIQSSLPEIKRIAKQVLKENNSNASVTLQYGYFYFPVRYYCDFCLPAGNYEALRVLIGKAEGHNWWCVLFPPICLTDSNASVSGKYTNQTPPQKIVIKWKSLEVIEKWSAKEKKNA